MSVSLDRSLGRSHSLAAVLGGVVSTILVHAALAGDWAETTEAGVLYIKNPSTPAASPFTITLEEVFRLGGDTDDDDQIFGVITRVCRDDEGNSYLLDGQLNEIRVFSDTGEFVEVFGREGEGPGEFRGASALMRLPNGNWGILQTVPGRIAQISPDGEPLSDYPIPSAGEGGFVVLRGGDASADFLFLTLQRNAPGDGKFTMGVSLTAVDADGNELATFVTESRELVFADPVIDEEVWDTFDRRWAPLADGRIFAVLKIDDYRINVWNADGSIDRIIERDYSPLARSAEEVTETKEIYERFTAQLPNARVEISENAPAVHSIYTRDDGSIWVLSGRGARDKPETAIGTFDVFSPEGHFVQQVTLEGQGDPMTDQFVFEDDRLYVITGFLDAAMSAFAAGGADDETDDDDVAPLEVICYRLDADALAMR